METIKITPRNVCSRAIEVDHENGVIKAVRFTGGCPGNTQGVGRLLVGMTLEEAVERLDGVQCRNGTSCPDQLAKGIKEYLHK